MGRRKREKESRGVRRGGYDREKVKTGEGDERVCIRVSAISVETERRVREAVRVAREGYGGEEGEETRESSSDEDEDEEDEEEEEEEEEEIEWDKEEDQEDDQLCGSRGNHANEGTSTPTLRLRRKLLQLHEMLMSHGFAADDALDALRHIDRDAMRGTLTKAQNELLDWLCLNLDRERVPARFIARNSDHHRVIAGAAEPAVVVRREEVKDADALETTTTMTMDDPALSGMKLLDREKEERGQMTANADAEEEQRRETTNTDNDAMKRWVEQYVTALSSDEEDEDDTDDESKTGTNAGGLGRKQEIAAKNLMGFSADEHWSRFLGAHDSGGQAPLPSWPVYSDERTVAYRKQFRSVAMVTTGDEAADSRADVVRMLARELEVATTFAKEAKGKRDATAQQKRSGVMIKELREEMVSLKVTNTEIEASRREVSTAGTNDEGNVSDDDSDVPGTAFFDDDDDADTGIVKGDASGDDDDDDEIELDIFDSAYDDDHGDNGDNGEIASAENATYIESSPTSTAPAKTTMPTPRPKHGAKHVQSATLPKALLSQYCSRQKVAAPKFTKLSLPRALQYGERTHAYSVTVMNRSSGTGKGRRSSRRTAGPVTLQFDADDDPAYMAWTSISDAQNAVATKALFLVCGDQQLHRVLPEPYAGMWAKWEAKRDDERRQEAAAQAGTGSIDAELMAQIDAIILAWRQQQRDGLKRASAENGGKRRSERATTTRKKPATTRFLRARGDIDARLLQDKQRITKTPAYQTMASSRQSLPIAAVRDEIIDALRSCDALVVSGETGSGKTTQVPQFILDSAILDGTGSICSIICTQPRRVAAISVAERVAVERCDDDLVGYHVRLDASMTRNTRLLFCTTGILLRRLQGDPLLARTSHVVVDEVHERTVQGDFLMALLRGIAAERRRRRAPPLKIVLMSATMDSGLVSAYFGNCPIVKAGGRCYPVSNVFLEDVYETTGYVLDPSSRASFDYEGENPDYEDHTSGGTDERYAPYSASVRRNLSRVREDVIDMDLMESLLEHLVDSVRTGCILVFLPGVGEITGLAQRLSALPMSTTPATGGTTTRQRVTVLPLHSALSAAEQRLVFRRAPEGTLKLVLATNIAETSITIDDVVVVVDCGRVKQQEYDSRRGMSALVETWASAANARQRMGRAGRTGPGTYYALYTRHRFEKQMLRSQRAEILRVPLTEICLLIKVLGQDPDSLLSECIQAPSPRAIEDAMRTLREVGALSRFDGELTPLGRHLATLPVDVRVGKLLIYGTLMRCLGPCLSIAAYLSSKSPFLDRQRGGIDHVLAIVEAYDGWAAAVSQRRTGGGGGTAAAAAQYCRRHGLCHETMFAFRDLRRQYASLLPTWSHGDDKSNSLGAMDAHAGCPEVVKAVLCGALYPNIAVFDARQRRWHDAHGDVRMSHESNARVPLLAVFHEKVKIRDRAVIRDATLVSAFALLLFGNSEMEVHHSDGTLVIDGWIQMRAPAMMAVLVREMRDALMCDFSKRVSGSLRSSSARFTTEGADTSLSSLVETVVDMLHAEAAAAAETTTTT